jgi:hypothetical protein
METKARQTGNHVIMVKHGLDVTLSITCYRLASLNSSDLKKVNMST